MKAVRFNSGDCDWIDKGKFTGVLDKMPPQLYHDANQYYSSSDLKYITKFSSLHFKLMRDSGTGKIKPTEDMILGSAVHSLLLTPESFDEEFFVCSEVDRRTKEGKEKHAANLIEAKDRVIIDLSLYAKASLIKEAILKNEKAAELLGPCLKEQSFFWKCPFSGLRLRARADACTADYLVEVKTSRSAKPSDFERQAYNMHYDLSAAHYAEGMAACWGERPRKVYFIVVENVAPHAVSVTDQVTDRFMDIGHQKWLSAITKLESCIATEKWSFYDEPFILDAPKWAGSNVLEGEVSDGI